MIRVVFMTDKGRVIGSSSQEENQKRHEMMPDGLSAVMEDLYKGDNVAGGESAWLEPTKGATNHRYVITRNRNFDVNDHDVQIVDEAFDLVAQYKYSEDELVIVGGLAMFRVFTPHASRLDVVETDELFPGDIVFDTWEQLDFELDSTDEHNGFRVLHYKREV
jgi:dihydrofolate reductase